jgi:uncharacterized membrane protein YccF (DUF307 family)
LNTSVRFTKSGPGLLVRAFWFLFIGWWLTGLLTAVAWIAAITLIGLPLGIYLINRIPTYLTLRPRTIEVETTVANGLVQTIERGRPQVAWYWRFAWFLLFGWWASALVMATAWLLCVLIVTLPIGLWIYNRVPFAASLYRY